jgi:hypothetical protein
MASNWGFVGAGRVGAPGGCLFAAHTQRHVRRRGNSSTDSAGRGARATAHDAKGSRARLELLDGKVARMEEQDLLASIRLGSGPQAPVRYRPEDVAVVRERGLDRS